MITNEIETNSSIKVDFKMSTLKPLLCSWLFTSWLYVCNKQEMVKVGWNKCRLLRSFGPEFQKDIMIQNMKSHLFKKDTSIQMDTSKNTDDEDIDVEESLKAIIEDTLQEFKNSPLLIVQLPWLQSVESQGKNKFACNNISINILYQLKFSFATFHSI